MALDLQFKNKHNFSAVIEEITCFVNLSMTVECDSCGFLAMLLVLTPFVVNLVFRLVV